MALVASAFALLSAESALATLTVDLIWSGTTGAGTPGDTFIEAEPGDRLTLDVFITVDEAGVDGYTLSVFFDDMSFRDQLDLVQTEEFDHVATVSCTPFPECFSDFGPELVNLTVGVEEENESDAMNGGSVVGFEAVAVDKHGPNDITILIGRIVFDVTENITGAGPNIEGSILTDIDGYLDSDLIFVGIDDLPNPALVPGFAPEPREALLAAAAMTTLALLRRRRRRQSGWV